MNNTVKTGVFALCALFINGCSNTQSEVPSTSPEGMPLVHEDIYTTAYKKEGVDFSNYESLFVLPSQVAFKKNWQRIYNNDPANSNHRMSEKDVEILKTKVATLFDETFNTELTKGPKKVLDKSGSTAGTLILKPFIINLDVNSPDGHAGSNVKTVESDSGEATLYLEIFDASNGEILARVIDDAVIGDEDGFAQLATRARNHADATRLIKRWAKRLNAQFVKAQAE